MRRSSASVLSSLITILSTLTILHIVTVTASPQDGPAVVTVSTITIPGPTVTTYVDAPTTPPSPQYTDALSMRTSVLNSTNFFRFQHNASFLAWNDSLALYAQAYSAECIWAHSSRPDGYGENLARGYPDITSAVDAWGNERDMYVFAPPDQITGFTEATGHFTQLVWKNTQTVGCGATSCDGQNGIGGFMFVCEYWPPGNINGVGNRRNAYFLQDVESQVVSGTAGFDTFSATAGATGVGTSTASGGSVPTLVPQSGADVVRVRACRQFWLGGVLGAVVLELVR